MKLEEKGKVEMEEGRGRRKRAVVPRQEGGGGGGKEGLEFVSFVSLSLLIRFISSKLFFDISLRCVWVICCGDTSGLL